MQVTEKTVVITGGGRGIGRAWRNGLAAMAGGDCGGRRLHRE
jgi:NAD(P)-dependent dehydrogenase (short-subunit alcohol dehydrogenase family)